MAPRKRHKNRTRVLLFQKQIDNKNMDKMEETVTADEECTCGEAAQLFLEWRRGVGRARSWSQTSTYYPKLSRIALQSVLFPS